MKANAHTGPGAPEAVRPVPILVLLLAALLGGCSDAGPTPLAVGTLDVVLHPGDTIRVVASVYNVGEAPLRLSGDCREWGIRGSGPLGNLTLEVVPCEGAKEIPVGGSASRGWTWEAARDHGLVGSLHRIRETPVEGPYNFEATFRAPQGPLKESATHSQDVVPTDASGGDGPGTLGWRLWSWPGHAALENRGKTHIPVAWDPCGPGLSGIDQNGTVLVQACSLGRTTFHLRPGFALHAQLEGAGAVAHLVDAAGKDASIVVQRQGTDEGMSWFTGAWQALTGAPVVLTANNTFRAFDSAHPGVVLVGSMDIADPWVSIRNEGARAYRYLTGCGMPWHLPEPGCTTEAVWLLPGGDLLDPEPPTDGVYRFHWAPGDVLGHRV